MTLITGHDDFTDSIFNTEAFKLIKYKSQAIFCLYNYSPDQLISDVILILILEQNESLISNFLQ